MQNRIDSSTLMALAALAAVTPASGEETRESHLRWMMVPDPNAPKVAMLVYPPPIASQPCPGERLLHRDPSS